MKDESRKRSLYFLLMTEARKQTLMSGDIEKARSISSNLEVSELEDSWLVVSKSAEAYVSIEIGKKNFQFYPTKNADSYEIEPSVLNQSSAQEVIKQLYEKVGITQHSEPQKVNRSFETLGFSLNPQHAVLIGLFSVSLLDLVLNLPETLVQVTIVLLLSYPFILIVGGSKKWLTKITLIPYAVCIFLIANLATETTNSIDALKFLSILLLVEILHHKILPKSTNLFQFLIVMTLMSSFFLEIKGYWGNFYLPILSLIVFSLTPSITSKLVFRKIVFLTGILLYCVTSLLFALDQPLWPFILCFILAQSLIFTLFGYRESASKLYLGMAFLAI
jgi:hypothetical protein